MSATARHPFEFLDDRLRVAVEAAAAAGQDPNDSLRGLYISDEQAIALSETGSRIEANAQLAAVAERLDLDALDATVLAVAAHPSCSRGTAACTPTSTTTSPASYLLPGSSPASSPDRASRRRTCSGASPDPHR